MLGYRVYCDLEDNRWKHEDYPSELGESTDFQFWFDTGNTSITKLDNLVRRKNEETKSDIRDLKDNSRDMIILTCKDCNKKYVMTGAEYHWYLNKGLNFPKRCKECRKKRKR